MYNIIHYFLIKYIYYDEIFIYNLVRLYTFYL